MRGIAQGCRLAGCALIGGETAEMPGLYQDDDYDLAGFAVGAAERGALLPREVRAGDVVIALPSSGLHSNGFSLARKVVALSGLGWTDPAPFADGLTMGAAFLTPTRIYVKQILEAMRATGAIKALAHITGGGFPDNIPRVLPDGLGARIDLSRIKAPAVFGWLATTGGIAEREMLRTFNCGVGMIVVVAANEAEAALDRPAALGARGLCAGRDHPGGRRRARQLYGNARAVSPRRVRTAILISGGGSNMARLIEAAGEPGYPAEIVLALSNDPAAAGLAKARAAGVEAVAIDHKPYGKDRAAFEAAMQAELAAREVELIALAGFMRVLTGDFVRHWSGRMINIHPSLLPKFRGLHTHQRAIEAGEAEHGCTAHWVVEELDAGEIIGQARVPVIAGDTPETLASRVLAEEHRLYPRALAEAARRIQIAGR